MHSKTQKNTLIEDKSINYVPASERHGHARSLFTLWFCTNLAPLALVTGAIATQIFHLDIISGATAIIAGHFFGGIFLGLTSAQGPKIGIPQMIQSRAQFGRYGSLLAICFIILVSTGFFISNVILSGKVIHETIALVSIPYATVIGAILTAAISIVGYNFIHKLNEWGSWVMGTALIVGMIYMFLQPLPEDFWHRGNFSFSGWFANFSICVAWQLAYTPYTSDYSRYLPKEVGIAWPFFYTWAGTFTGNILAFLFGLVAVNIVGGDAEAMVAVHKATGLMGPLLLVLFLINIIFHNSINLYGSVMSLITAVQTFIPRWVPNARMRVAFSLFVLLGSIFISLAASANFINLFIDLVLALIAVLFPWCMINILDFYIVKKRHYDVDSIFRADGGQYGLLDKKALLVYLIGILVQIPFMDNALYNGPYAHLIPGADSSWVISLVVVGLLYPFFSRRNIPDIINNTD